MPDTIPLDAPSGEPAWKLHDTEPAATIPDAERPPADAAPAKRLIRLRDLFAMLDVSKPTGHRLLAAGRIGPRPIRLTSACVRFDADEVDTWLRSRKPDGALHSAATWGAVWEAIKRRKRV